MGTFNSLSDRLGHIFSKLKNKGKLTELEVKGAMREVRIALLATVLERKFFAVYLQQNKLLIL